VTDGDPETYWSSRFGYDRAHIDVDLGEPINIAGMRILFGYGSANFAVRYETNYSKNGSLWPTAYTFTGNGNDLVEQDSRTKHFRAQFLRLELREPKVLIFHPDDYGNMWNKGPLFTVKEWDVFDHPGGGGAVGIQSLDGSEFMTLGYGMRQPGEWLIQSENDVFTKDLEAEPGVFAEDIGTVAHFVITFARIGGTPQMRQTEIAVYRNGVPYGKPYVRTVPSNRLSAVNQTRMVFGVRSTAHDELSVDEDGNRLMNWSLDPSKPNARDNVVHGDTHSPFFDGSVYNVTLIKNALTPEEVRGLYDVVTVPNGKELGCHCYDACPAGSNRFFPDVPVPCSGQGVCARNPGEIMGNGNCRCTQGYSGPACEDHCSQNSSSLTTWGCCQVEDDCPVGLGCDIGLNSVDTFACVTTTTTTTTTSTVNITASNNSTSAASSRRLIDEL
jgi:hypothetical protein